jgi:hypothetical protein
VSEHEILHKMGKYLYGNQKWSKGYAISTKCANDFDQDSILVKNIGTLDTDSAKFDSHFNNKHSNPPFPPFNVVCSVLDVQDVTQHWLGG